jgi:hypothetical protein
MFFCQYGGDLLRFKVERGALYSSWNSDLEYDRIFVSPNGTNVLRGLPVVIVFLSFYSMPPLGQCKACYLTVTVCVWLISAPQF